MPLFGFFRFVGPVLLGLGGLILVCRRQCRTPCRMYWLICAFLFVHSGGQWTLWSPMSTGRAKHTSTLLGNDTVLLCGGSDLPTCDLWDQVTGTFITLAQNMSSPRVSHTATLLSNSKVLICGGFSPNVRTTVRSCDVYDPSSMTFTATGQMSDTRSQHVATLLGNGLVLVCSGFDIAAFSKTCEIYSSVLGTWATTGSLSTAHVSGRATLLANNQSVLICGGSNGTWLATCEIYDAATGVFTAASNMIDSRALHTANLLPGGLQVLACGGDICCSGTPIRRCEVYNIGTNSWAATQPMSIVRSSHVSSLFLETNIVICGGSNGGASLNTCDLFNITSQSWTTMQAMTYVRTAASATLLSTGSVLVCGGNNGFNKSATCESFYDCTDFHASIPSVVCANSSIPISGASTASSGPGIWSAVPSSGVSISNGTVPITDFISTSSSPFTLTWSSIRCSIRQTVSVVSGPTALFLQNAISSCGATGTVYVGALLSGDAVSGNWSAVQPSSAIMFSKSDAAFTGVSWTLNSPSQTFNLSFVPKSACNVPIYLTFDVAPSCPTVLTTGEVVGIAVVRQLEV